MKPRPSKLLWCDLIFMLHVACKHAAAGAAHEVGVTPAMGHECTSCGSRLIVVA